MAASVSFVIPTLNEAAHIEALLARLRVRFAEAELLVVDGGSTDDTAALARHQGARVLSSATGRALQMNMGGEAASGDTVFFLHADSFPTVDADTLEAYLADAPQWGFCPVRLSADALAYRVIEWFINRRSALTQVATGDQMLFIRRDLFTRTGGFEALPLMEDVAYSKRLRQIATPLILSEPVHTSSRRWEQQGVVRTVLQMWGLRLAYWCGVSPARLQRHYYGS
jgi:rSAM/selenodomain-associated transferase 2